ncbi:MAG: DUF3108 domain-containing protein [Chloroflexota bacterium]
MRKNGKQRGMIPLVTAVAFSLAFHVILCLSFAEVKGFDIIPHPNAGSIVALLVEERPDRQGTGGSARAVTRASDTSLTVLSPPQESDKPFAPEERDEPIAAEEQTPSSEDAEEAAQSASGTGHAGDVEPLTCTDPLLPEQETAYQDTTDRIYASTDPVTDSGPRETNEEDLQYTLTWQGMTVGRMSLFHRKNGEESMILSRISSAPVLSLIYRVDGNAESTLRQGVPVSFRERHEAGRRRSDKETIFDPAHGRVVFMNHMKGTRSEHLATGALWDFVSGLYYIRAQDLDVGRKVTFNVFDSKKVFRVDVDVLRKEQIDTGHGATRTIVLRPVVTPQSEKSSKLFEKASDILIWLTDDTSKTPIRIEAATKIGRVVAQLKTPGQEE